MFDEDRVGIELKSRANGGKNILIFPFARSIRSEKEREYDRTRKSKSIEQNSRTKKGRNNLQKEGSRIIQWIDREREEGISKKEEEDRVT